MACTTSGLPLSSDRFLRGMPFDPPRAGTTTSTRTRDPCSAMLICGGMVAQRGRLAGRILCGGGE